jgi:hypothetical protein
MWHGLFEEAPFRVANKGIIGSRVSSVKFERIERIRGFMLYSISSIARPGRKGVARKNHEAAFILWAGRASLSFPKTVGLSL